MIPIQSSWCNNTNERQPSRFFKLAPVFSMGCPFQDACPSHGTWATAKGTGITILFATTKTNKVINMNRAMGDSI
jgi:hypothetical protein